MPDSTIRSNTWAPCLYQPTFTDGTPNDYKVIYGGRGSSKTLEVTRALAILGHNNPLRVVMCREHQKSIEESAYPELVARIRELRIARPDCYTIKRDSIDHANGTHFFFRGLSTVSEEDIKGLANVDLCWIEEAHRMSHSSWELLRPTIRKDGAPIYPGYPPKSAEIWATLNPKNRTDAIYTFAFKTPRNPRIFLKKVNYTDNAFFPDKLNQDRLDTQRDNPERYKHIWLGEPDDAGEARKVLPYYLLDYCVKMWEKRPERGAFVTAGLDVADTGADKNALALRSGPELFRLETWRGSDSFTTSDTAARAARICDEEGVMRLHYDSMGVGAGIRGPLRDYEPAFSFQGESFGGKPQGEDVVFITGRNSKTNGQYFRNWAAQAGWALRLRAMMTQRLAKGEDVDPHECLFINPELHRLEDVLAELSQPEWDDASGKMKVDKQPKDPGQTAPPSPDAYDAAILAFSGDASRGLRERRMR